MITHTNTDLGWLVEGVRLLAHYYRTSNTSRVTIAHCGYMARKASLKPLVIGPRCGFCQAIEDIHQDENIVLVSP